MKSKTLPGISEAVKFINACAGVRLVRGRNRLSITATSIDFLVVKSSEEGGAVMSYALSALWRGLGSQTRTVSVRDREAVLEAGAGASMFYEWSFPPPAGKLRLILTTDGLTIIRLSSQVTERRRG